MFLPTRLAYRYDKTFIHIIFIYLISIKEVDIIIFTSNKSARLFQYSSFLFYLLPCYSKFQPEHYVIMNEVLITELCFEQIHFRVHLS